MPPLLSIIVPVYNCADLLPRCLDSLLNQHFQTPTPNEPSQEPPYEIICIDDGSTDQSPQILARYQQQHPHLIRVITQTNQGPGPARNNGLDHARGEYITFADSDDAVLPDAYPYIYHHYCHPSPFSPSASSMQAAAPSQPSSPTPPDIVQYDYLIITPYTPQEKIDRTTPQGQITFSGTTADLFNRTNEYQLWNKFYRRNFLELDHIRFPQLTYAEDSFFTLHTALCPGRALLTNSRVYLYSKLNPNSIVLTTNRQRILRHMDDLLTFHQACAHYLSSGQPPYPIHPTNSSPSAVTSSQASPSLSFQPDLRPGVNMNRHAQLYTYFRRALTITLTPDEWRQQMTRLRQSEPYDRLTRHVHFPPGAPFFNAIRLSYTLYRFHAFLYQHIFLPLQNNKQRRRDRRQRRK